MASLVVRSKVKEAAGGLRISGDLADALSKKVGEIIQKAGERAKSNGRSTIRPADL